MKAANFLVLVLIGLIISCNNKHKDVSLNTADAAEQAAVKTNLIGSFVGNFGDNKITLLITRATTDSVSGRTIVGGNDRPFIGTVNNSADVYVINAKEPGDDPHDGIFNFNIDPKIPGELKGNWSPYKATANISAKDYSLKRKAFSYSKDVGEFPEASGRLLIESDVNNLAKEELEYMRNEIFARHGYCFKKKSLREGFENQEWYVPNTVDVKKDLTEIERKNILLIKKFEKYALEYGDDFGR
jgi:hypothetical protein